MQSAADDANTVPLAVADGSAWMTMTKSAVASTRIRSSRDARASFRRLRRMLRDVGSGTDTDRKETTSTSFKRSKCTSAAIEPSPRYAIREPSQQSRNYAKQTCCPQQGYLIQRKNGIFTVKLHTRGKSVSSPSAALLHLTCGGTGRGKGCCSYFAVFGGVKVGRGTKRFDSIAFEDRVRPSRGEIPVLVRRSTVGNGLELRPLGSQWWELRCLWS
jgi:hypothetical protein